MNANPRNETRLFEAYLRGNLSKQEESKLVDWINSSEKNYREFKSYIAKNQFSQPHSEETVRAWQKLKSKITRHPVQRGSREIIISSWMKIAAIVVIALLSGFFASQIVQKDHYSQALNEIIVPKGEKAQVILSDGTKVYLNAGTYFKYPAIFSKEKREVILTGEAFFDVAKDKSNPFIIETPKFDVKVTGTSFNLSTYEEDEVNSLTLHSGELTISRQGQEYKLRPGEKYRLNIQTRKSNIETVNLQRSLLWTEGVIVIDDLNLEEIRKLLERKFDVQIKIADEKYKKIRYSGQFKSHETMEGVLKLIRETSPVKFKYEINETKDMITIK